MEDLKKLRDEAWQEFKDDFIEPIKHHKFAKISSSEDFAKYKIIRKHSDIEFEPTMQELNFIYALINAQEKSHKLVPYIWVLAFSYYTENISEYCQKRLLKTLVANGFEVYPGIKHSIILRDDDFDNNIKKKLASVKLSGKEFTELLEEFIDDIEIVMI